jgi:hypothetical protein
MYLESGMQALFFHGYFVALLAEKSVQGVYI